MKVDVVLPITFSLLWSTGFIGAKYGLPYSGPFTLLAIRFAITVFFLSLYFIIKKLSLPKKRNDYISIFISGMLIHVAYLGGIFTAIELGLAAGMVAAIVGMQPIITTFIFYGVKKLSTYVVALLGFVGILLVVSDRFSTEGLPLAAISCCLISLLGITFGTIYQKKHCSSENIFVVAFLQYIPTLFVFALLSFWFENDQEIVWNVKFITTLLWLSIVLSIGAILLMNLLYQKNSASTAANYFYLAPPLTLIQGAIFFGENLGSLNILGIAMVALSIYLNANYKV